MNDKFFWDSNLWIYLFTKSADPVDILKKEALHFILSAQPHLVTSVQVLNEVSYVLMRKYGHSETDVLGFLRQILSLTENQPLFKEQTLRALDIKARYQLGWYDSLIVVSALESDCEFLHSEDLHDGLVIENSLTVINPFTGVVS